jgi:hypothetical protein
MIVINPRKISKFKIFAIIYYTYMDLNYLLQNKRDTNRNKHGNQAKRKLIP